MNLTKAALFRTHRQSKHVFGYVVTQIDCEWSLAKSELNEYKMIG
jgi:hypothetical protein